MANKSKSGSSQNTFEQSAGLKDYQLQSTLDEFLAEERKENNNIWNFATITGIATFFVAMLFVLQEVFSIGPSMQGLMEVLPLIAGLLVAFVGFGFFIGDRKRSRKKRRKADHSKKYDFDYDFGESTSGSTRDSDEEDFSTSNFKHGSSSKSRNFDSYAFRQSKKLYKSRSNKKIAGVCGGLAKYTGISPTVIRLLFVVTFFAGSGASLLAYIALSIALDKEPVGMMEDFDF